MFQYIKQLSFLNRVFNVEENEWPRIFIAWMIRFLYRIGFALGWTVLVAMMVAKYGISFLPYLFILNGIFTILGSLVFSFFLDRYRKDTIMIFTIFASIFFLIWAYFFAFRSEVMFFSFLILVISVFLVQFKIMLDGYIEEMFNPLQSERTFPLIEAAETIAGIFAGLIITLLATSIESFQFIYLWIGFLVLILPCLFAFRAMDMKVSILNKKKHSLNLLSVFGKFKSEFFSLKHLSFLKGLFLIVFLQWFIANLVEFQYTKAVYQNVSQVILQAGSGFEHAFIHDLGALFILFSASALIVQLFVGSRLINYLGIVGSMLLHVIVTFLSIFGWLFMFNFTTAVLAKNNFTITNVIHTNAYHSSYYAIREHYREHIREFLEGIVRPIGAILGTFVLIFLQTVFAGKELIFSVNILILLFVGLLFYVTYVQQNRYTNAALDDLVAIGDLKMRINAIDILAQKGHRNFLPALRKILFDKSESLTIKVRILKCFGELKSVEAIPDIINCFSSNNATIRKSALLALLIYKDLNSILKGNLFLEYQLILGLKKMYRAERVEEIRSKVVLVLSMLSTVTAVEFLIEVLGKSKGKLKADTIMALGNYRDSSIVHFIYPYLNSKSSQQKVAAIIALGKVSDMKAEAMSHVNILVRSLVKEDVISALFIVGQLNLKEKRNICLEFLNSSDSEIRLNAAIALAKMGVFEAIPVLVEFLFSPDHKLSLECKKLLENVDVRIYKNIDRIMKYIVYEKAKNIVIENEGKPLAKFGKRSLSTLSWLYSLIEEYDEVESIHKLIKT